MLAAIFAVINTSTSGVGSGIIIITTATNTSIPTTRSLRRETKASKRADKSDMIIAAADAKRKRGTRGGPHSRVHRPTALGSPAGRALDGRHRASSAVGQ